MRDFLVLDKIKSCQKFSLVLKLALVSVSLFRQDVAKGNVFILLASLQKLSPKASGRKTERFSRTTTIACHSQHRASSDCTSNSHVFRLYVLPDAKLGDRVVQAIQV